MDHPSIIKLLEDDEDESMHSGADVEALSAALNRDIGGDSSTFPQPSDSESVGVLPSSSASQQLLEQWQSSSQEGNIMKDIQTKEEQPHSKSEQHSSHIDSTQQVDSAKDQDQQTSIQPKNDQPELQPEHSRSNQQLQSGTNSTHSVENEVKNFDQTFQFPKQEESPQFPKVEDNTQHSESQQQTIHQALNEQPTAAANEANNAAKRMRSSPSIPFQLLIPIIRPHLDKDRAMQLQSVFNKLRANEVSKDDFLRVIRNIVGDQMLRQAVNKVHMQLQAQAAKSQQTSTNQYPIQNQAPQQQHLSRGAHQFPDSRAFSSVNSMPSSQNPKGHRSPPRQPIPSSTVQMQMDTIFPPVENIGQKSRDMENNSDARGSTIHASQMHSTSKNIVNPDKEVSGNSLQGINKQQLHSQRPQTSFPMYGGSSSNFPSHPYARPPISATTALRSQLQDPQMMPSQHTQSMASTQLGSTQPGNVANVPKYEMQNIGNEAKRLHGASLTSHSASQQHPVSWHPMANKEQRSGSHPLMPHVKQETFDQISSPPVADATTKPPLKKPSVGQKKPLEAVTNSPSSASKKQKTSGAFHDQSIEHLNDVTAVSGVNLREEEEQLLSAPKEDSRASEATRRVVQEEEERSILQKGPLQRKLADIMFKSGLKNINSDVERCLSLCIEERLRGVISSMIRLSRQRVDIEKTAHRFVITSDVHRHILEVNKKAKEEWDKKQAEEADKLRKVNEAEGSTGSDADKDKDDARSKSNKGVINKEEDDKMRTTAANVAARAAVGGDDMMSKWQLMAEQARQKREGLDWPSPSQTSKVTSSKPSSAKRNLREQQETHRRGSSSISASGGNRRFGRSPAAMTQSKVARNLSRKDVIAVLEKESQMSKSTLIYRLYEKLSGESTVE